jgi:hypothetical protein
MGWSDVEKIHGVRKMGCAPPKSMLVLKRHSFQPIGLSRPLENHCFKLWRYWICLKIFIYCIKGKFVVLS